MRFLRRPPAVASGVLFAAIALFIPRGAPADDTPRAGGTEPPVAVGQDTDPTKPVLFSIRDEYYHFLSGSWVNYLILRRDALAWDKTPLLGKARGVLFRMELPLATSDLGGQTTTGLGDGYVQALLLPRLGGNWVLGIGTGLMIPTATDRRLGTGKWTIAPAIAPVWFLPRQAYAYVKFQEFESFAGTSSRPDISYLLITPTALWRVSRRYWVLVDSESRTSWTLHGTTSYRSGLLVGRMFTPRAGFSLKAEVPWGNHRLGDWTLKANFYLTRF